MTTILQNSIWPNDDGNLGNIKVQIPDGINVKWPEGDALFGNCVYQNGKLVGFVDAKALTVNSSGSTTINYDYVNIELPFAKDAMVINRGPHSKYIFIKFNDKELEEDGSVIVTLKYKGCKTVDDIKVVNPDYLTNDIVDGVWSEGLGDLEQGGNGTYGGGMFQNCDNLISFSSNLSSLTDGRYMFYDCDNLISFFSDLSSLTDGNSMFGSCWDLTSFTSDLSSLTHAETMFDGCKNLTLFNADLPKLRDGDRMFIDCESLNTFNIDLPSLTRGADMFEDCINLKSFTSDLSNLVNGFNMFYKCKNLELFHSDLPSLEDGDSMFFGCTQLTSFSSDSSGSPVNLSKLEDGAFMFSGCYNLTSFLSDLPSLTNGLEMFSGCKLDAPSVKNIIDKINTYSATFDLDLGMGCNDTTEDKELFAQEVGYADMTSLLAALQAKGWTVDAQYNGRPTTTYGLRRPSENTLPIFAKLEEVEKYANYTSIDGSKKYMLNWFHETTGSTEGYTQFNSLEEAVAYFNIKPIERN